MNLQILWTPIAETTFQETVKYLTSEWSEITAYQFIARTHAILSNLSTFPLMYKSINDKLKIRKGLINKHISFFYRVKASSIEILYFWDNRRNPEDSEYNVQ